MTTPRRALAAEASTGGPADAGACRDDAGTEAAAERRRRDALHRLSVLDTPAEPLFDAITDAAAQVCEVPIALLSLVDGERQWFKSSRGLPGVGQTPRELAFCDHAIRGGQLFEVGDATRDARFAGNPLVTGEPNIRFYAGAPIVLPGGERVGTVCVIDRRPRTLTEAQRATLASLGRVASAALSERSRAVATRAELAASEARHRAIVEDQTELISLAAPDGTLTFVNAAYARQFGSEPARMVGRNLFDFVDEADRPAVRQHWQAVCTQRRAVVGVNRSRTADGGARWVQWSNRPIVDADGAVASIQSVGRDITEQRLAEAALADNERRARVLYEATPAPMHSIDPQGRLLNVSNRWLDLLGHARDEVIGRPVTDFMTPESARHARETVRPAFFRTGRCDNVEYTLLRRDGSALDVRLSGVLERDADGRPLRALAVLEDVTETRRMADELGRTHARLDAIVDNVPALLGHWDANGITRLANREFQAATGLPLDRIVGAPLPVIFEAVDPAAYPLLAPRVASVLRGTRQDFELAMLTTAGLRQLRVTLVPEQPIDGRVDGFYGMAHDITGRKALELRLSESELRYRSLFDNLNSGFALHQIVSGPDGRAVDYRFLAMNEAFAAMTGLQPADTLGRRVTEVLPGIEDDPAGWITVFGEVVASGAPCHFEQRSAALGRWFEVVAYRPAAGQFAVIAQDITQRREAQARLQDALHEKETLLKEVYHRVKNNLQVVQSLLNLQRRNLPDGPARVALADTVQRVRAMALVHEKLYQSGNLAAVSLPDYTRDLLRQIDDATGALQRGIGLHAELAPVQTSLDSAIPFGLLVTELVTNALKHGFAPADSGVGGGSGGRGGAVRVTLAAADGGALLAVEDDGGGLADDFALAGNSSMGLQLAANLARQLGGELAAHAQPGGARFSALLTRL